MQVDPISPAIGAEVAGIDLRTELDQESFDQLQQLLYRHRVLVFREQRITDAQHVAFARRFGELELHPTHAHVDDHPELIVLQADEKNSRKENIFHADITFMERPAKGSVLRCVECPPSGGDTIWTNMVLAFEKLPPTVKDQVEGLCAVHDLMPNFGVQTGEERRRKLRQEYPAVEHPVVIEHPVTGERVLFVNQGFTTHIANYEIKIDGRRGREFRVDSTKLLIDLLQQAEIPEYQMRLKWKPDTVVIWDNFATQHYAVLDYFPQRRRMVRATIRGDVAPAPPGARESSRFGHHAS